MDMEGQRLSAKVLDRYARPDEARLDAMLKEELDKARIKIVVLDEGTVAGVGAHDQLMGSNKIYREIYDSQQEGGGGNG